MATLISLSIKTKLADELNSSLSTLAYSFPHGLTFHQSIALSAKLRFTPHRFVALSTISVSCFCTLPFGWCVILGGREGDCSPLTLNCFDSSMIKFRGCDKKIKALHALAGGNNSQYAKARSTSEQKEKWKIMIEEKKKFRY